MVDESIKNMLFQKEFKGDPITLLIEVFNILERVERHISVIKTDLKTNVEDINCMKMREETLSMSVTELRNRDRSIEAIAAKSLKVSLVAMVAIIIIGVQTAPDFITKFLGLLIK